MRKICFLKNDYNGGGTERVVSIIANELAEKMDEFEIFVLDIYNPEKTTTFNLNSKVNHFSLRTTESKGKFQVLKNNYLIYRFLKKNKIDLLINIQAMMGINSFLSTLFSNTKNIVWDHANYYQKQHSKFINVVRQIQLLTSSYYLVLTKADKENFSSKFHLHCPIDYIYNPAPTPSTGSYTSDSKNIISVGHLTNIKGFDRLIDVGNIVFSKHRDWKWNIYGEGKERKSLEKKVKEMNLEKNIIFHGRTDDVENVYKNSSLYVLTSRMEGLPMVLLEASSFKLPLISFDIETGPSEIIVDGVNGYLVPDNDILGMALSIQNLIEDPLKRNEISANSTNELEKFNINYILVKWNKIFNEVFYK